MPDGDFGIDDRRVTVRGTVFFVHGGAWGSGMPWMYRLVAPTFLRLNFAVVIVGYRYGLYISVARRGPRYFALPS